MWAGKWHKREFTNSYDSLSNASNVTNMVIKKLGAKQPRWYVANARKEAMLPRNARPLTPVVQLVKDRIQPRIVRARAT